MIYQDYVSDHWAVESATCNLPNGEAVADIIKTAIGNPGTLTGDICRFYNALLVCQIEVRISYPDHILRYKHGNR